ncbi:MAG TPA: hypothetical protein VI386_17840 [Candidatus Sulfotelmatobacter sp.]
MSTTIKVSKRIHTVTIKRMVDESPDTSWLGEYSNNPTSEFSIDRAHSLDCPQQTYNTKSSNRCMTVIAYTDKLERAIAYLSSQRKSIGNDSENPLYWTLDESLDILASAQDEISEEANACTCGESADMSHGEYRYFNPSFNYVDKQGSALPENSPEDVRKYVRQDYERMERLNAGDWCFIGIRAEAEVCLLAGIHGGSVIQHVTSGGLWGIEADSNANYIKSVEDEELSDLRDQLAAIGFSKRAIATAFKDVTREGN